MTIDELRIDNLSHSFGDEPVLENVNLSFPLGQLVAILGPSGCGKTTLLKCVASLIRPTSGEILFQGHSLHTENNPGLIGVAFQSPTLLPWRTARDNVLLPAELLNKKRHDYSRDAQRLLELVGLKDEQHKFPFELSGGMKQRVALARALVTKPSLLLLDEPFGALDGITRDRLNETVRQLWIQYGTTILFVTHSIEEAVFLADNVVILSHRPARVREIVPISLGNDRGPFVRSTRDFFDFVTKIRKITEDSP